MTIARLCNKIATFGYNQPDTDIVSTALHVTYIDGITLQATKCCNVASNITT